MRCDSCSFRQHNVLTRLQRLGEEASRRRLRVSSPDGTMRGGRRIACGSGIPHGMSDPEQSFARVRVMGFYQEPDKT
jgi:hypothetical protein